MRLALWAPALAAVAAGDPSIFWSSTSAAATATISASTATPTQDLSPTQGSLEFLCDVGGRSIENWNKYNMGGFINAYSSMWCSDTTKCPYGSWTGPWPMIFSTLMENTGSWTCTVDECDASVKRRDADCTDNKEAKVQFALYAVQNFRDWMESLIDAIDDSWSHYNGIQTYLVNTFTTHDIDNSNDVADGLSISSGVMGIVGTLAGPFGPAGKAVSEMASIGSDVLALAGDIAGLDTPNPAEVLQEELDTNGNMSVVMDAAFGRAKSYYMDLLGHVIEDYPTDNSGGSDGDRYTSDPRGAPAVLYSGMYAVNVHYREKERALNLARTLTDTMAINYLWGTEKVYIAKLTKPVGGTSPCDAYHTFEDLWGACDENTSTLYLYVPWGDVLKNDKWTPVPGIETLAGWEYDADSDDSDFSTTVHVDLFRMGKAAEYNQQTNGYGSPGSVNSMLTSMQSKDAGLENVMTVSLPVCYLDNIIDHYYEMDSENTLETAVKDALHRGCGSISRNVRDWPYEYILSDSEPAQYYNQNPYTDGAKDSIILYDSGYVKIPRVDDDWKLVWD